MLLPDLLAQISHSLGGGIHAQIGQDQTLFQLVVKIVIDLGKAGKYAAEGIAQRVAGLA